MNQTEVFTGARHEASGAQPAVVAYSENGELHAGEFQRQVAGIAQSLWQRPERRWALVCNDTLWFAAGFLGLLAAHKTVILPQAGSPINVREAQADAVLTDQSAHFIGLNIQDAMGLGESNTLADTALDDEASIELYTSGSTGRPKRVDKRLGQLRAEVTALEAQWGSALGNAVVLASVPHHHLYGLLFRVLWPLWAGRPIYTLTCAQPFEFNAAAQRFGRCAIVSSPALLTRVENFSVLQPRDNFVALFSSGAPLPEATAAKIATELGRAAVEVYGSTETGGIAWRSWQSSMGQTPWQCFPNVETTVGGSESGVLRVRTPWTWQADWTDTGDLAQALPQHRFLLRGRVDGVLKVEDKRVSLAEMEQRLLAHQFVQAARLVRLESRRVSIGAVVALNDAGRLEIERIGAAGLRKLLANSLRGWYEPVLVPRKWRFVAALSGNDMGKVEHEKLQALFTERH